MPTGTGQVPESMAKPLTEPQRDQIRRQEAEQARAFDQVASVPGAMMQTRLSGRDSVGKMSK